MLRTALDILLKVFSPVPEWLKRRRERKVRRARLNPLIVQDNGTERLFTWRGRGAVHLIGDEEEPRQLGHFFILLSKALGQQSGMEPRFNRPDNIRGEVVFEISADLQAKWRLLGGEGGKPSHQVLVLVPKG